MGKPTLAHGSKPPENLGVGTPGGHPLPTHPLPTHPLPTHPLPTHPLPTHPLQTICPA